jgi:hypothetical protein
MGDGEGTALNVGNTFPQAEEPRWNKKQRTNYTLHFSYMEKCKEESVKGSYIYQENKELTNQVQ